LKCFYTDINNVSWVITHSVATFMSTQYLYPE